MTCCNCGSFKVENRDLLLCSSCNKARRKAEQVKPPTPRKALRPVSLKKGAALREKKQAYAIVDQRPRVCVSCGCSHNLTHSHVLPVGNFPQHEANPDNIVLECLERHSEWEHNKPLAKRTHASWQMKMDIMQRLEPAYFELFKLKNPTLFP